MASNVARMKILPVNFNRWYGAKESTGGLSAHPQYQRIRHTYSVCTLQGLLQNDPISTNQHIAFCLRPICEKRNDLLVANFSTNELLPQMDDLSRYVC